MSWTKTAGPVKKPGITPEADSLSGIAQQLRLIADQLEAGDVVGSEMDGVIDELDKIGVVLSNY